MRRVLYGVGAMSTVGLAAAYVKYRIEDSYKEIFSRFQSKPYYDREVLKREFGDKINRDTPSGIIFVCGRVNNGKTSLVKSMLKNRKYVAYMNWRSKPDIWETEKLIKDLRSTFKISSFYDSLPGMLPRLFMDWLPRFKTRDTNSNKLEDMLDQIEEVLKFSYLRNKNGNVQDRPVIFIDEVHQLVSPDGTVSESAQKFVNWLVEMSKDNHYCDVVVCTTDANSKAIFALSNPKYVSTIIVDDLRKEDFEIIIKEYWRDHGNGIKQQPWLGPSSVSKAIEEVGGTAGGVIDLCSTRSQLSFYKTLIDLRRQEKERFDILLANSKKQCGFLIRTKNCYTFDEFKKVANVIIEKGGNSDPKFPIGTLARESKVSEEVIWLFVRLNYLFVEPRDVNNQFPVMFSSKLFMDVYKEDLKPMLRYEKLASMRNNLLRSLRDTTFDFESDKLDTVRQIEELEREMARLGK
eukprot:gene5813-8019_t